MLKIRLNDTEKEQLTALCAKFDYPPSHSGMIAALDRALDLVYFMIEQNTPEQPRKNPKETEPAPTFLSLPETEPRMKKIVAIAKSIKTDSPKDALIFCANLVTFFILVSESGE